MPELVPSSFADLIRDRPADAQLGSARGGAGVPTAVDGATWLRALPALLEKQLRQWDLEIVGPSRHGECALVVPVRRESGEAAALKLTWPHAEARHEHLALRLWDGRGAVRLLAADPSAAVLLLEALDADRSLRAEPLLEACEVIGSLMTALDRPAPPQVDRVAAKADRWRDQLGGGHALVPRRLTDQAVSSLDALVADQPAERLVHVDLHDLNVLAPLDASPVARARNHARPHAPDVGHSSDRGEWLAIDPKPVAGEWAYAVAPVVWNRGDEAVRATNLRTHVRLRAEVVTEAAGLDEDRVRAWTFVRLVLNARWAADHAPASDEFRARMIALSKAFAD